MRIIGRLAIVAALACGAAAARADVLLLKDGKKVEGIVADKGNAYEVKTKYGTLRVDKADVKAVYQEPAQMLQEAELCRKLARGMYEDALKIERDAKERNRKLTAGLELLEKALKQYTEAREIFDEAAYKRLDADMTAIVQEMRLYRDKMTTEQAPKPPDPASVAPAPAARPPDPPAAAPDPVVLEPPVKPPPAPVAVVAPAVKVNLDEPGPAKATGDLPSDLKSSDAAVRRAAVERVGKGAGPETLALVLELLKKEEDAGVLKALGPALGLFDGALLAKQEAAKDVAQNGTEARKRALLAAFKKAGGEPGMRFVVDQFVARATGAPLRNDVASALKKNKTVAVKPLLDLFRRAGRQADLQGDIIKYLGIAGESKLSPQVLIPLLDADLFRSLALHALRKIDKPVVPALINALSGSPNVRLCAWGLLKYFTGQTHSYQRTAEWAQWWTMNQREVAAEEAKWDKADEAADWPVDNADWEEYNAEIVGHPRYFAWGTGQLGFYESSRGRTRESETQDDDKSTRRPPRRFPPRVHRGDD